MKKLFLLLALFLISGCIAVDDFGEAWMNAGKDPSLMGDWMPVVKDANADMPDMFRIVDSGLSFRVTPYKAGKKLKEKKDQLALKTLQAGDYRFVLGRDGKMGSMTRYAIMDDSLSLYSLNPEAAWQFIARKYPHHAFERDAAQSGQWDYIRIKKLDAPTLAILAAIPDNDYFWRLESRFRREKTDALQRGY